jgi:hypothetical protein
MSKFTDAEMNVLHKLMISKETDIKKFCEELKKANPDVERNPKAVRGKLQNLGYRISEIKRDKKSVFSVKDTKDKVSEKFAKGLAAMGSKYGVPEKQNTEEHEKSPCKKLKLLDDDDDDFDDLPTQEPSILNLQLPAKYNHFVLTTASKHYIFWVHPPLEDTENQFKVNFKVINFDGNPVVKAEVKMTLKANSDLFEGVLNFGDVKPEFEDQVYEWDIIVPFATKIDHIRRAKVMNPETLRMYAVDLKPKDDVQSAFL